MTLFRLIRKGIILISTLHYHRIDIPLMRQNIDRTEIGGKVTEDEGKAFAKTATENYCCCNYNFN